MLLRVMNSRSLRSMWTRSVNGSRVEIGFDVDFVGAAVSTAMFTKLTRPARGGTVFETGVQNR